MGTVAFSAACLAGAGRGSAAPLAESPNPVAAKSAPEFIGVGGDGKGFVFSGSGSKFTPWGFNYDHDRDNRLLETYWKEEWNTVAADFSEMKALGATVARIHLQLSRFMKTPAEPNAEALGLLGRLAALAEQTGLYLDVTGLGCYDKKDVPKWYNDLEEGPRWEVQARFWEAVAGVCHRSPAVFCYDLMNEPLVSEDKKTRDWTPGAFGDRYFLQRLTLDFAGRADKEVAKAWVDKLVTAIRSRDRRHLITVGAVPWALTWPNAKPLFYSKEVGANLDFVSLHFYPKSGEVEKALKALAVYDVGKPIVIEETFPLTCPVGELDRFIEGSRNLACGWIGFYWGKTVAEYRRENRSVADGITMEWLEYFAKKTPEIVKPEGGPSPVPGND